jgi:hypothetical protein
MIDDSLSFSFLPSAEFSEEYISTEQGSEAACDPDKNVWSDICIKPSYKNTALRAVGAHLHFGYDNPEEEISKNLIKVFELYGTVTTLKYEDRMSAIRRRELYGAAGSHRIKPYGVEYRSLSSFWLSSEDMVRLIYNKAEESIERLNNDDGSLIEEINADKKSIIYAVNFHDKMSVDYLNDKYKLAI